MKIKHLLIDIDSTITQSVQPDIHLEAKNPWGTGHPLGGLQSIMVAQGWDVDEAHKKIMDYAEDINWWDYTDFISMFELPLEKTWRAFEEWHEKNVKAYDDAVAMVKTLAKRSDLNLYIMSNNPYCGCCLKLAVAGLADRFGSQYFTRIFGTNILRGLKGVRGVWRRVFANIGCDPKTIGTIGDNFQEDNVIPLEEGAGHAFVIKREQEEDVVEDGKTTIVNSLELIPSLL